MSTRLGFVLTLSVALLVQNHVGLFQLYFNLDIQGPYSDFSSSDQPIADQSALHRSSTLYQANQALL